jgi:anti-sigma B factor antagonist
VTTANRAGEPPSGLAYTLAMLGVPVITPRGDLVGDSLSELERELEPHLQRPDLGLVLDLSEVGYVGSVGLGLFVRAGKTLAEAGGVLVMARPSRSVERVLRAIGLDQVFPLFRTVADARSWIAQRAPHEL